MLQFIPTPPEKLKNRPLTFMMVNVCSKVYQSGQSFGKKQFKELFKNF